MTEAPPRDLRFELPELNTWRVFNKSVSQAGVLSLVQLWEAQGYRLGAVTIDDGWQTDGLMGEWTADPLRFADPAALVAALHRRGYGVRLWAAPCQVHPGTEAYEQAHPEALMKNRSGQPSFFTGLGTYTLDIRHPWAREHVRQVIQQMVRQWNVDAFKVDFPPFYEPGDAYYQLRGYDLPEQDQQNMVRDFYALVREALDEVRPGIRIEAYSNCVGAAPYINDCTAGDLVGCGRSLPELQDHVVKLKSYIADRPIVPWFEMVWGEGADHPHPGVEWHAGFLEYMAATINFGLKIEHSFPPFAYPNAEQIRILSNLYGPRDTCIKVLQAGRRSFDVAQLIAAKVDVGPHTRFLVAPEVDTPVQLHTAPLHTNALGWRGRNVLTEQPVTLRGRNEYWGGTRDVCRVEFDARGGQVYELWYEGEPTDYFNRLLDEHLTPPVRSS